MTGKIRVLVYNMHPALGECCQMLALQIPVCLRQLSFLLSFWSAGIAYSLDGWPVKFSLKKLARFLKYVAD